ncbi:hypothetical protein [Ferrovum myxofaciens]|uniref:Uncharacterized protein n=1 Tax=Ferrovum myxofaciens TaxID=416213 RepID=A0A9E6SYQ9_9PROT|nr:hypothetical protein [Ferrovum myxofaciens]QKE37937.1 MAG: hypothetical protein HO273_03645 [Ferrovum myxofaciens]QWY75629.1 MAG: hypothetical protein JVY19_04135 [Ferrovum myxofaciens]QWY78365.1 MAG: hypothetical protein JZL65_04625 [Ferrovum myxofaciens]
MNPHEIKLTRVDTEELHKYCSAPWRYHETSMKEKSQHALQVWPMLKEISGFWQRVS